MSMRDWRQKWKIRRWVTLADFPLLALDINPETFEEGHSEASELGNDLLKRASGSNTGKVMLKLSDGPGSPLRKYLHIDRMMRAPGDIAVPLLMDFEVRMQDAIAFAMEEEWPIPDWLRDLYRESAERAKPEPPVSNGDFANRSLPVGDMPFDDKAGTLIERANTREGLAMEGVTRQVIMEKFRLAPEWDERLRKAPSGKRYRYLKGVWTSKGAVGGDPSLYSPARVAKALIGRDKGGGQAGKFNLNAMVAVINNQFPEWEEEWLSITDPSF